MSTWTLASWNVNSVRTRLEHILSWLKSERPDVLCLQETKTRDDQFPEDAFQEAGWHVATHGQPSYNGVALVSQSPLADVRPGFPGDPDPDQARVLCGTFRSTRVVNLYVPNGSEVGSEPFAYKLGWLVALRCWLEESHDPETPLVLTGDFNIAPEDRDVYDPEKLRGRVLCSQPERQALRDLMAWGLEDVFRLHHPEPGLYSWWDYRAGRFRRNQGLRIDLVLATAPLARRTVASRIDVTPRGAARPPDHTPVTATFEE